MSEQHRSTSAPAPRPPEGIDPVETTPVTWWLTGISLVTAGAACAAAVFLGGVHATADTPSGVEVSAYRPDPDRVGELLEDTRMAYEELAPVVGVMEVFLPTDGSHPSLEPTEASVIHSWRTGVREAAEYLGEPPEGTDVHDLAHAGLASSVRLLSMSVETYARAALVEDEDLRMDVLHIAMDLRDQAVLSWEPAAAQLDMVSVDTGHGPFELYLSEPPEEGRSDPGDGAGTEGGSGGGHDH